ncbi:HNH endonuclease [Marinitenerispora sediminis]|uniref:HNH endonuclease n=1 Tax=Marinitenerispora sediminis TaxID=1931232 RepID=A0A368T6E8_9ACTN|nr:HNH endonuclease [Marinitenerispora sediminis]RCV59309.1 HNH endonuclease [Marinitenerispora sediminis]
MTAWAGSDRRRRLPANWPALRRLVLERDGHRCTWTEHGQRCPQPATDVDHIWPGDDHSPANLRSLCRGHHQAKSSAEGGRAASAKRPKRNREPEPHPGVTTRVPRGE